MKTSNLLLLFVFILSAGLGGSCKKPTEFDLAQEAPELIGKWEWFKTEFRYEFQDPHLTIDSIDNVYTIDIESKGRILFFKDNITIEELNISGLLRKRNVLVENVIYVMYVFIIEQITGIEALQINFQPVLKEIYLNSIPYSGEGQGEVPYNFYKPYE